MGRLITAARTAAPVFRVCDWLPPVATTGSVKRGRKVHQFPSRKVHHLRPGRS
jgi:hypothetical protein